MLNQEFPLSFILNNISDLVAVLDLKGRRVYNSPSYKETLNDPKKLKGTDSFSEIHPEDREKIKKIFFETVKTGIGKRTEYRFLRKDGSIRYIESQGDVIKDKDGKVKNVIVVSRDVTERKQLENRIRFLALALSSTKECFLLTDLDSKIIFVNKAFCQTFGYREEELIGKKINILYSSKNDKQLPKEIIKSTLKGEWKGELYSKRKDGTYFPIELWTSILKDDTGKIVGMIGIARDITEQKKSEKLQSAIYKISNAALNSENLQVLFDQIHQIVSELMPAKNFYIALYDKRNEILSFPYFVDEYDKPPMPKKLGKGLTEYVLRKGKPLLVTPTIFDELLKKKEIESIGAPSIDWLGVPLKIKNKTIGVLVVQSYTEGIRYSESDKDVLVFVSEQIATAIERKRSEKALLESEARLNEAQRIAQIGSWELDIQKNILKWSDEIYRMFDIDPKQFGASYEAFLNSIHPEDREFVNKAYAESLETRKPYNIEHRLLMRDGSIKYVQERCKTFYDNNGKPIRSIGTVQDITDRKKFEEKIIEQAELIEMVPSAIYIRDMYHRILFWSKGAEKTYGWTKEDVYGKSVLELFYKPENLEHFNEIMSLLLEKGTWTGELKHLNKAGKEIIIDGYWRLLYDNEGKPKSILCVNTDITEKKLLERQHLRSQRMESIGTLVGGIAHDLNNVLAPILLSLEIFKRKFQDETSQEMLDTLGKTVERGAGIVKQVLTFARGAEGERAIIQPRHIISDLIKVMQETFPKSISIKTEISKNLWVISADPNQLHQIILNLCINARDAMPDGGILTIEAENIHIDTNYTRTHIDAKVGPYVLISVSDTGIGIPQENIDRIFEPFFTTKELGKGTGLGLSTVLSLVKGHGGFINVYSEPSKGTKFKVYLPAIEGDELSIINPKREELPIGNGESILIIDDEDSICQITKETLEAHGYKVYTAHEGKEGIEIFKKYKDEIDLVITDIMMPTMDGLTAIRELRKIKHGVKIIASSGLMEDARTVQIKENNIEGILVKPYTAEKLLTIVSNVLSAKK
jgi:PAS domain S-box-containing protein